MHFFKTRLSLLLSVFFLFYTFTLVAQVEKGILKGTIYDEETETPLIGVDVLLLDSETSKILQGVTSGDSGQYKFNNLKLDYPYKLALHYIGYKESHILVKINKAPVKTLDIHLKVEPYDLNTVTVTAPWQMEKVVTSTSSTTILDQREIETEVHLSPITALRKVAGVDLARLGIDRYELAIRGFNDYLSTATFVMTDFRAAANPAIGGNFFQLMPITQIDLERIEVIRGPGSSLYGSGVDAGVVHFLSKDPFDYRGTTITFSGGERESFQTAFRHAGVSRNGKWGYKVVGSRSTANDWHFSAEDSLDQGSLVYDQVPRQYDTEKINFYSNIKYKVNPRTWISFNGGLSRVSGDVNLRVVPYRLENAYNIFGQLQIQSGNYFGQAHYTQNIFDNGFFYSAPDFPFKEKSSVFRMQHQYDLVFPKDKGRFIIGSDIGFLNPETEGTIHGRYEEDDRTLEFGGYAQLTMALLKKLDFTFSARTDYDNVNEEFNIGPRAGFAFKPDRKNIFRAFYAKTHSTISSLDLFLDVSLVAPGGVLGPVGLRVLGNQDGFTFNRNPVYGSFAESDLVAASLNPDAVGAEMPLGMFLSPFFNAVYGILAQGAGLGAPLPGYTMQQTLAILQALNPQTNPVEGFSDGKIGILNPLGATIELVDEVNDYEALKPTATETFEIGYKGLLGDRLAVSADVFHIKRKNFLGQIDLVTPLVYVPNLQTDFRNTLMNNFAQNPALQGLGLSEPEISNLVNLFVAQADSFLSLSGIQDVPIGFLNPAESGANNELLFAATNFGEVKFWGFDLALQYFASSRFDVFSNLSYINDNFFDDEELNEAGTGRGVSVNKPKLKFSGGFNYKVPHGLSLNATARYNGAYQMLYGFFVGEIEEQLLFDAGAGYDLYKLTPGLRFDIQALNVTDKRHRRFIGSPKTGRMVMARLTWHF